MLKSLSDAAPSHVAGACNYTGTRVEVRICGCKEDTAMILRACGHKKDNEGVTGASRHDIKVPGHMEDTAKVTAMVLWHVVALEVTPVVVGLTAGLQVTNKDP